MANEIRKGNYPARGISVAPKIGGEIRFTKQRDTLDYFIPGSTFTFESEADGRTWRWTDVTPSIEGDEVTFTLDPARAIDVTSEGKIGVVVPLNFARETPQE